MPCSESNGECGSHQFGLSFSVYQMSDKKDKKAKSNSKKALAIASPSTQAASPSTNLAVPIIALQRTIEDEIVNKWNTRPFSRFPIHKDIPRFIRTIKVLGTAGEILYKPEETESQPKAIHRLIKSLAMVFEPDKVRFTILYDILSILLRVTNRCIELQKRLRSW